MDLDDADSAVQEAVKPVPDVPDVPDKPKQPDTPGRRDKPEKVDLSGAELDLGWGERPREPDRMSEEDERLLRERPPHWE